MSGRSETLNVAVHPVGLDGYFTFVLSNLALVFSLGIYWAWLFKFVLEQAKQAPVTTTSCDIISILGLRPENDEISAEFKQRLDRGITLFEQGFANKILLIGGKTGNNKKSEALLAMDYLLTKGVARENILLEDSSRHTLENLHHARSMYLGKKNKTTCLVTSRYHLARSHVFAQGLNIWHRLCAAEDEFTLDFRNALHFAREAYFIHWYKVGKWWSNTMNSQHSMRRIS